MEEVEREVTDGGGALLWLYSVCLAEVLPSGSNIVRKVQRERERE